MPFSKTTIAVIGRAMLHHIDVRDSRKRQTEPQRGFWGRKSIGPDWDDAVDRQDFSQHAGRRHWVRMYVIACVLVAFVRLWLRKDCGF